MPHSLCDKLFHLAEILARLLVIHVTSLVFEFFSVLQVKKRSLFRRRIGSRNGPVTDTFGRSLRQLE